MEFLRRPVVGVLREELDALTVIRQECSRCNHPWAAII
ncbi:hypothetical protein ABID25_006415 [Mesorhizobium abyssinicae]